MAIKISGTTGIDMGNTSVSNLDVGVLAENAVTKQYVDDNVLLSPNDSRVKTALNATGSAPIYACRAWVNFNGMGTVAIRASGNVSSITDNGTGSYTVNFTTAMPDDKYSISGICRYEGGVTSSIIELANGVPLASSVQIVTVNNGLSGLFDSQIVSLNIFR